VSDPTEEPVLVVNGLTVSFTTGDGRPPTPRRVVDDVSFALRRGRVLTLVGESGSGKSVTAMSLVGLLPPTATVAGSARLEGRELIGAERSLLRQTRGGSIGTVFQDPMGAFNPAYPIGWQLAEAIRVHDRAATRAQASDRATELLSSVGLTEPKRIARSFPHQLSGGQLQRAMIAMAISSDPIALIADEPTTALDVTVQAGILELLRSLKDERGMAVLLITHDMGVVADVADDVVVMRAGEVVERAPVGGLFAAPSAEYTRMLLAAVPRLERLGQVAAEPPAEPEPAPAAPPAVEVRDVRIVYGGRGWRRKPVVAVDGASFRIDPGRTLGLVGESGSGKSTLGRALVGLAPVRQGSIVVGGQELTDASRSRLRRARATIGYVFQDPASSINPRYTIGQAIAEPMRLLTSLPRSQRQARVTELLDAVQLPASFAERYQHELSGGQRQRVAIARALALRPALLIADEPTSALDVSVQAHVLELLGQLREEFGFACLFISHDLAVVQQLAEDVIVMHSGRIVEAGPTERVLVAPREPYTRRLVTAAPVADPDEQRGRRAAWLAAEREEPAA
jgi:peptide/nickel transport system ATP-binding protein